MVIGTCISITTLNVNGLNAPTERQRLAEKIKKQDPYTCCKKKDPLQNQRHIQTESEGMEKSKALWTSKS